MEPVSIFVSSSNDLAVERALCGTVVDELNGCVAPDRDLILSLVRWETDTAPGLHERGIQGVIDDDIPIEQCDVVVGIFWKRFGTPTSNGKTGTEHEIEAAKTAYSQTGRPRIMLWFRDVAEHDAGFDSEEHRKVRHFRSKQSGVVRSYRNPPDFEAGLRTDLTKFLRQEYEVVPRPEMPRDHALKAVARVRHNLTLWLLSQWGSREWDHSECQAALDCYEELRAPARDALQRPDLDRQNEKRNALWLVFSKRRLEDVLDVLRWSDTWPAVMPQLGNDDLSRITALLNDPLEDVLAGVFQLVMRAESKGRQIRRAIERLAGFATDSLSADGIMPVILERLTDLEHAPYVAAVKALSNSKAADSIRGERWRLALTPLLRSMRSGISFKESLQVAEYINGKSGRDALTQLWWDLTLEAEGSADEDKRAAATSKAKQIGAALTRLGLPRFAGEDKNEGSTEAPYTVMDW